MSPDARDTLPLYTDLAVRARALAGSTRIRDQFRLIFAAPRLLQALIEELITQERFFRDQLRRRDLDYAALTGRRSVELEAAAREGWRQALAVPLDSAVGKLDLDAVRHAATVAKPREVLGEMAIQRVRGVQ